MARLHAALLAVGLGIVALPALTACARGGAPTLPAIGNQEVAVGSSLTIILLGSDPDGDQLSYSYKAAPPEGSNTPLDGTSSLTVRGDGAGVFTWNPLADQVGSWFVDFTASDGNGNSTTTTVLIEVKSALGEGAVPIFRKPTGGGTVLDLSQNDCVLLDLVVDDSDSNDVDLIELPPTVEGAELELGTPSGGISGSWSWCPSRAQINDSTKYDLAFQATDGDGNIAMKPYTIVLRGRGNEDCPGDLPVIDHQAQASVESLFDIEVTATISDTEGLGSEPLLQYAFEDPVEDGVVDYSKLEVAQMKIQSGDATDGVWRGLIPNPAAKADTPDSGEVWYVITAVDDDDKEGDCDHQVDAPAEGAFNTAVTNPGGNGNGTCSQCSADAQCGGAGDLCVALPDETTVCGTACTGSGDCDSGFECSAQALSSVEEKTGRQCVPTSGTCKQGGGMCVNDEFEPNANSSEAPPIPAGDSEGTLCSEGPFYEFDWFEIDVPETASIVASLDGPNSPDMDIYLSDADDKLVASSNDFFTSNELIESYCVESGTYYLSVESFDDFEGGGEYTLSYFLDTDTCGAPKGPCCESGEGQGCNDAQVEACVCDQDPLCCNNQWDNICVIEVESFGCGVCEEPQEPNNACCQARPFDQKLPGCLDKDIQACVCAQDSWCCDDNWDSFCVSKVDSLGCGTCMGGGEGDCCEANGSPGCEAPDVEACVCDFDVLCCDDNVGWDETCVGIVGDEGCGLCPE